MESKKTALFYTEEKIHFDRVYGDNVINTINSELNTKFVWEKSKITEKVENTKDVSYIFTTWGMQHFTTEEIKECFPSLEAIFYAAGSVQHFAREFLSLGIKVFSAWGANGVPVSEYTAAQIILANKGFFGSSLLYSCGKRNEAVSYFNSFRGNYGQNVGIIGAGMIGKLVIKKLKEYKLNILVFDPFLPDETAKALGVTKCSLERIFSECVTVSNHLANNDQTAGMLNYSLFSRMQDNAVFINTGRGRQVVEPDLVRALTEKPTRYAILDVTFPEPPEEGHPFFKMPNVILTPHIAGSMGDETKMMAEYMLNEYQNYTQNKPTQYEVTLKMLETMA